jgi:uncharacterized protein YkwD
VPAPGSPRRPEPRPAYDRATLERLVLDAANDARATQRLRPLRPDAALTRAARAHSEDLARTGRFSHTGSDGSRGDDRAARAGAVFEAFGENLYESTLHRGGTRTRYPDGRVVEAYDWIAPEDLARDAVEAWLDSPGHRANLLRAGFSRAGTGVAFDDAFGWVVTMDYAD